MYSPQPSNFLNFTSVNSTFTSGTTFSLTDWRLSDTITKIASGDFRVQVYWYNSTAVGFKEVILTVVLEDNTEIVDLSRVYTERSYYQH